LPFFQGGLTPISGILTNDCEVHPEFFQFSFKLTKFQHHDSTNRLGTWVIMETVTSRIVLQTKFIMSEFPEIKGP
jgi:hypothetical protein